jgi:hypothetical protein
LGRTPVFLVFNGDPDALLGMKIRKRIISGGPFEVIVPPAGDGGARYEELSRAKGALLCSAKAGRDWLAREVAGLNSAMVDSKVFDLRRALLVPAAEEVAGLDVFDEDEILRSEDEIGPFLEKLLGAAA